jgi:uroporphyrin-3 C-methyltransferase
MNNNLLPETTDILPEAGAGNGRKLPLSWRSPLALVIAILAVLLIWQWLDGRARIQDLREELAHRLAENDVVVRDSRVLAKQNQDTVSALQTRVAVLENGFSEAQGQQLALESMYQELSRSRDERLLAEVEQTITIAAQQLQLAGNVEAALIALNGADARLARAAQPQFLPLRKLIARDIGNLTALPVADISGMALKIDSVVAQIDSLPLAFEQRPKAAVPIAGSHAASADKAVETSSAWWRVLLDDLWQELQQLIRIERVDHSDPGLLAPSQAYFLRENIKLHLINARLALLARDGRSFRDDTRQVADWLGRYFDTQSRLVQAAQATVKSLATMDIVQQAPSLNETLAAVRNFKVARERK